MRSRRFDKAISIVIYAAVVFAFFIWFVAYQNANASLKDGQAQLSFLDVGQADCAILNLPNSVQVVIDTGRDASVVSKVAAKMPTFDKKIEYVMLSHPDSDHVGGFDALSQSYEIGEVIRSSADSDSKTWQKIVTDIKEKNIRDEIVGANDEVYISANTKFHILWPARSASSLPEVATTLQAGTADAGRPNNSTNLSSNNSSIVANLSVGSSRAIFMGDAENEAQNGILSSQKSDDLMAQIIKVSHHGSINGLNQDLLKSIKPQFAIVSVGKNSYGHPSDTVLSAFTNLGIQYFRTDKVGAIDFVSNGEVWTKK